MPAATPSEDAGALAWLVLGYAHMLDQDYAKAIDPLNRAKPHAGDLGDYVDYYLGTSYFQSGQAAEAIAILSDFEKNYPESLLLRDARVLYGNALLADNRPQEAIAVAGERPRAAAGRSGTCAGPRLCSGGRHRESCRRSCAISTITMPLSAEAEPGRHRT